MNSADAYQLWCQQPGQAATVEDAIAMAFQAGWNAKASMAEQLTAKASPLGTNALDIWAAWPVKKARGAAIPAITKAIKKRGADQLLADVVAYAEAYKTWPAEERRFLPMCSTWMNQERWLDDRQTWIKGAAAAPSQFSRSY